MVTTIATPVDNSDMWYRKGGKSRRVKWVWNKKQANSSFTLSSNDVVSSNGHNKISRLNKSFIRNISLFREFEIIVASLFLNSKWRLRCEDRLWFFRIFMKSWVSIGYELCINRDIHLLLLTWPSLRRASGQSSSGNSMIYHRFYIFLVMIYKCF